MGIETKYKCDCCGHEQDNAEQMWNVGVYFGPCTLHNLSHEAGKIWCRKCMERIGVLSGKENPAQKVPPEPLPTLEGIVRQIMREEITDMTGAA
jgi:hypothetical protein